MGSSGRPTKEDEHLARLIGLGLFSLSAAKLAGVSQSSLSRLVDAGKVLRLERNLYRHPDADVDPETEDYAVACSKFGPKSVLGAMTALQYHALTDQVPQQIWVLVPPERWRSGDRYRCIRTKTPLDIGIEDHYLYRITGVERTLAEAFRYATKIGLETAIRAARIANQNGVTTPAKIMTMARKLGYESHVMKHWEAIVVE